MSTERTDLGVGDLRSTGTGRVASGTARRAQGTAPTQDLPTTAGGPGRLLSIEQVGDRVRILRVGRPPGFSFTPGQYVRLGVGDSKPRKFTIASAPSDDMVEFCVALNPAGTLTPKLFEAVQGAQLEIGSKTAGDFTLDPAATHHVMVATVTGIAPFRSMLRAALGRGSASSGRTFTLLHGASSQADLPYRSEMARLAESVAGFRYIPTVSRPELAANGSWQGETGRVDRLAARVISAFDRNATCVYACGNSAMVASVRRHMSSSGFRIRTETFN